MTQKTIVIAGLPETVNLDFTGRVLHYADRENLVTRLVDDRAGVLVLGEALPGWQGWLDTVRASPATRRIPVILVVGDSGGAGEFTGVEEVVTPVELRAVVARLLSTAEAHSLPCDDPLPALAAQAVEQLNAGEYYRQHDMLEELWMTTEGPIRDLYQGILQAGVACYQVQNGNRRAALKMLLRAGTRLDSLPDICQGVDVASLREDVLRLRRLLEAMAGDDDLHDFPHGRLIRVYFAVQ